jgi:cell fate regulator YaaT (PSP1 superfamily)
MKITDVEYQGDGAKATFYYTAEGRVDFRQLLKNMLLLSKRKLI